MLNKTLLLRQGKQGFSQFAASKASGLLIYLLLLLILLGGIRLRCASSAVPICDRDTWSYLTPGMVFLAKGEIAKTYRAFPYPATLYAWLKLFGTFNAITIVQASLGIATGLLLWASWLRLREWMCLKGATFDFLFKAFGLMLVWVYLLSARPMVLERTIRPESTFPFLGSLEIYLSLALLSATLKKPRPCLASFITTALAFNSLLLYEWRPNWILALPFSLLPVAAVWWFHPIPRLKTCLSFATGVILFLLLIWLPEEWLNRHYLPHERPFVPTLLFCIHAKPIRLVLLDELKSNKPTRYDRALLEQVLASIDYALTNPPGTQLYPSLGFDPDYLIYRDSTATLLDNAFDHDDKRYSSFCYYYYVQAWLHYPHLMAWKIIKEVNLFYGPDKHIAARGDRLVAHERYAEALPLVQTRNKGTTGRNPVFIKYLADVEAVQSQINIVRQWKKMERIQKAISYSYTVLLAAFLVLTVKVFRNPGLAEYRTLFALGAWFYTFNFGMTLTTSITHSMKIGRYTDMQYQFTLFSYFAGLAILLAFAFRKSGAPDVAS